jgi:predicted permease
MGGRWVRDASFALRRLRRAPGESLVSVLTLALGIGATVALYSVVKGVLLDPLPYDRPDELVAIFEAHPAREVTRNVTNPGTLRDWRERVGALDGAEGIVMQQPQVVEGRGVPVEVQANLVTPGFFALLGVEPTLGRGFDAGADPATEVVLSHRGWQELFGGDPEIVGEGVRISGSSVTVVGVLPPVVVPFAEGSALFYSYPLEALGDQGTIGRFIWGVGRLAPEAGMGRLDEELDAVSRALAEEWPDFHTGWEANAVPLDEVLLGDVRAGLWTLLGAVALLLVVAAMNVANVTMARVADRRREMAVRSALGAGTGALSRQLFTESLLLAGAGGLVGVAAAWVAVRVAAIRLPAGFTLPRIETVGLDPTVLVAALAVTAGSGLVLGFIPALHARRASPATTLRAEGRGPSRWSGRFRAGLVVVEVALSVVLLSGAALLVRSFVTLTAQDPGFDAASVVTARVNLRGERWADDDEARWRFHREVQGELARIPGVEAAGAVSFLPLDGLGSATSYAPGDRPEPARGEWPVADVRTVAGSYFEAMEIDLVRGRSFDARDGADTPRRVVVSRALAEAHWPDADPVGKSIVINWNDLEPWTIVGVVADVRHAGLDQEPRAMVYLNHEQAPWFASLFVVVRARGEAGPVVSAIRAAVSRLDPAVPVTRVRVMDEVVSAATAHARITTFLLGAFALVSALLASVGLYGVLSTAVARRVREIGVRMALGASASAVVGEVLRRGGTWVGGGLLAGLAAALASGGLLRSLLYGVPPRDPLALAGAVLLFGAVACVASLVPAIRAVRVHPVEALRAE